MHTNEPLLAGHPAVRRLVNLGFRTASALRRRSLAQADPVRAQELELDRLVKKARATRFGHDHHFERHRLGRRVSASGPDPYL